MVVAEHSRNLVACLSAGRVYKTLVGFCTDDTNHDNKRLRCDDLWKREKRFIIKI